MNKATGTWLIWIGCIELAAALGAALYSGPIDYHMRIFWLGVSSGCFVIGGGLITAGATILLAARREP